MICGLSLLSISEGKGRHFGISLIFCIPFQHNNEFVQSSYEIQLSNIYKLHHTLLAITHYNYQLGTPLHAVERGRG